MCVRYRLQQPPDSQTSDRSCAEVRQQPVVNRARWHAARCLTTKNQRRQQPQHTCRTYRRVDGLWCVDVLLKHRGGGGAGRRSRATRSAPHTHPARARTLERTSTRLTTVTQGVVPALVQANGNSWKGRAPTRAAAGSRRGFTATVWHRSSRGTHTTYRHLLLNKVAALAGLAGVRLCHCVERSGARVALARNLHTRRPRVS